MADTAEKFRERGGGRLNKRFGVFLDRDGTITEEAGYLTDSKRLKLIPGSAEAIALLNRFKIPAVVATNQAGVARGYFEEFMVKECNRKLKDMLRRLGAKLDAIYYCPHHPDVGIPPYRKNCDCRKPKPGMLLRAAKKFNLDLSKSYVIGDKATDLEVAAVVSARPILVKTGYGLGEILYGRAKWKIKPITVCENLFEAVSFIIDKEF